MTRFGSALLLAGALSFMPFLLAAADTGTPDAGTAIPERVQIPPPPAPQITSEAQATAVLRDHGVTALRRLGQIGDYWEGAGLVKGQPVAVYLFADGTLWIRRYPPGLLTQAFGGLPQAEQTATAP